MRSRLTAIGVARRAPSNHGAHGNRAGVASYVIVNFLPSSLTFRQIYWREIGDNPGAELAMALASCTGLVHYLVSSTYSYGTANPLHCWPVLRTLPAELGRRWIQMQQ